MWSPLTGAILPLLSHKALYGTGPGASSDLAVAAVQLRLAKDKISYRAEGQAVATGVGTIEVSIPPAAVLSLWSLQTGG